MDEQLVFRAKSGETKAFTELIHNIENDLYRIAKTRLNNDDDISDAIQETMIKAFQKLKTLKDNSKFKSWIIKICINECNTVYKKSNKQNILYKKIENSTFSQLEYTSTQSIDSTFDFELLISTLKYKEKLIITLFYNSQYSCKEISQILNINTNTVKSILKRAKEKIKKNYNFKGGLTI